jgi:hypothetical protein
MLSELRRELVVAHPPAGVADLPVLRHILQLDRVRHPAAVEASRTTDGEGRAGSAPVHRHKVTAAGDLGFGAATRQPSGLARRDGAVQLRMDDQARRWCRQRRKKRGCKITKWRNPPQLGSRHDGLHRREPAIVPQVHLGVNDGLKPSSAESQGGRIFTTNNGHWPPSGARITCVRFDLALLAAAASRRRCCSMRSCRWTYDIRSL